MARPGDQREVSHALERIFGAQTSGGDQGRVGASVVPLTAPPTQSRWLVGLVPVVALGAIAFFLTEAQTSQVAASHVAPVRAPAAVAGTGRPPPIAFSAVAPSATGTSASTMHANPPPGRAIVAPVPVRAPAPRVVPSAPPRATASAASTAKPSWLATGDISSNCRPGSNEDACIYRDVRDADRRLVQVYRQAVRAGVPRDTLVRTTKAWNRALGHSLDDPDGTIRRYDELADELHAATQVALRGR